MEVRTLTQVTNKEEFSWVIFILSLSRSASLQQAREKGREKAIERERWKEGERNDGTGRETVIRP
jgi:hypothetical protein